MPRNKEISTFKRVVYILIGSFIHSYAINALLVPHDLLTGGLTGIAMIIEHFTGFPVAITVVLLNIPLFIAGYRLISKRFVYFSMLGIFSMSFFLTLTKGWALDIKSPMIASI